LTTGKEVIDHLYYNYLKLSDLIGKENLLDTENETPEETTTRILNTISIF